MGASAPLSFRTSRCAAHRHPEFTIVFRRPMPIPSLERMLLDHFEEAVAAGTRFLPGQIVRAGWADFRLIERSDATLGLEERDAHATSEWTESVDHSLMQVWVQQEVCRSLGFEDSSFPQQTQSALVCSELFDAPGPYWLDRLKPMSDLDSGWFIGCLGAEHDHNQEENLTKVWPLWHLVVRMPFLGQFLALPTGTQLEVEPPPHVAAKVLIDGVERLPRAGSYLEALNRHRD